MRTPQKPLKKAQEGMPRGTAPDFRYVQDCGGAQNGKRMDAKFGSEIWGGRVII